MLVAPTKEEHASLLIGFYIPIKVFFLTSNFFSSNRFLKQQTCIIKLSKLKLSTIPYEHVLNLHITTRKFAKKKCMSSKMVKNHKIKYEIKSLILLLKQVYPFSLILTNSNFQKTTPCFITYSTTCSATCFVDYRLTILSTHLLTKYSTTVRFNN
jgi:hypothetical protein